MNDYWNGFLRLKNLIISLILLKFITFRRLHHRNCDNGLETGGRLTGFFVRFFPGIGDFPNELVPCSNWSHRCCGRILEAEATVAPVSWTFLGFKKKRKSITYFGFLIINLIFENHLLKTCLGHTHTVAGLIPIEEEQRKRPSRSLKIISVLVW